jgi:hypothetical protein
MPAAAAGAAAAPLLLPVLVLVQVLECGRRARKATERQNVTAPKVARVSAQQLSL